MLYTLNLYNVRCQIYFDKKNTNKDVYKKNIYKLDYIKMIAFVHQETLKSKQATHKVGEKIYKAHI